MFLIEKIFIGENVLCVVIVCIEWIFEIFLLVCLFFLGGKDFIVFFYFVVEVVCRRKCYFFVLFIDWEVQYQCIIEYIQKMWEMYWDVMDIFYWVVFFLIMVNGVLQFQLEWICWEFGVIWVCQLLEEVIIDMMYFFFYWYVMMFEEFVLVFFFWFVGNWCGVVILIGVCVDELFNCFMGLVFQCKLRYVDDKFWIIVLFEGFYYIMNLLYDWKVCDIWIYNVRICVIYNFLYDLMYCVGVLLCNMCVCEFFGFE